MRTFSLVLLFAWVGAWAVDSVRVEAVLTDSAFAGEEVVRLEVLETGEMAQVRPGRPFVLTLPADTLWNLCFAVDSLEKCFLLENSGYDTSFQATIGGEPTVVNAPQEVVPPADLAETEPTFEEQDDSEGLAVLRAEESVRLQRVVLRVRRAPKRALGKSVISAKAIKRLPGLAEADVIRSIQGLPGVVSSSDFSTKIYVRGGGSDQNLILFDNAVVFSPVHFFGLFSTFLVEGIDNVEFYKGGFAPEYGNRLSSVLDIKSRDGGPDSGWTMLDKASLKISTFASQAHVEGGGGGLRYLLAGRSTYISQVLWALRRAGLTDLDLDYFFYDLQGNVMWQPAPGHTLRLSGYHGQDKLDFNPFLLDWGNTIIPLNWEWRISENLRSKATLAWSDFFQTFDLANIQRFYNAIETYAVKERLIWDGIPDHELTVGADLEHTDVTFISELSFNDQTFKDRSDFLLLALYLQDRWTLGPWEFTSGLRGTWQSLLREAAVEPRLSVKLALPRHQTLEAHVGKYLQYVNSINFSDFESVNEFYYYSGPMKYKRIEPSGSLLFSLGYRAEHLPLDLTYSLEGYFKTLDNLLVFAPSDQPDSVVQDPDAPLGDAFKSGEGYSYGLEVSLRREFGALSGGFSYSRGVAVSRDEGDEEAYHPKWHQAHAFKADAAVNWKGEDAFWPHKKKGRYLRSSVQFKYATGLPYTDYEGYVPAHLPDQGLQGGGGPAPVFFGNIATPRGVRNAATVPPYLRLDIKPLDMGREGKWNFSWTILNVTGNENIFLYAYDESKNPPELITVTQFPFFPLLFSYEYYF